MFRLPVAAIALGVCLLKADTLQQIKIDFHEFHPVDAPVFIGDYYAGGTAATTDGFPGPDYGIYDAVSSTSYTGHWVTGFGESFLYHGGGRIGATRGMFDSISMLIKGGFPGDPPDAFLISVLDAGGNLIGSTRVGYMTEFTPISIAFSGQASQLVFGDVNYFEADYFQFTDLVTYVPMADARTSTPEPSYAAIAGMLLLGFGAFRMRRKRLA
jgi:hypothetical protein